MIVNSQGRLQDRRPVSVIDIGSNSIRLVIYEGIARAPTILFNEKMLAGLGRSIATTGELDPDGVRRSMAEFRRFRAISEQVGAVQLHVIATAAVREAVNGPQFVAAVEQILGTPIHVLTGGEEARYCALGVISGFHSSDGIAGDLGGGSLELVDVRDEKSGQAITLPLGSLRLQDMTAGSPEQAVGLVRRELERAPFVASGGGRDFYAVGGTWRNLARLHMTQVNHPLNVMHHYQIDPLESVDFLDRVARGPLAKMPGIGAVSKNRRALLPYGAIVLEEILRVITPARIVFSGLGVREGFLYSLLAERDRAKDPLLAAAEELAILRSRSVTHARELADWTGRSFAAFKVEETPEEVRYRRAACLLADIGWRAHPDYRGTQSLNIISHASFIGIDHPGRAYIALAILYRHEGLLDDAAALEIKALATPRLSRRARLLGALFRVVYLLSAAMPGVIPKLSWREAGDGRLVLVVPRTHANLIGERPSGRLAQLARLVERPLDFAIDPSP